MSLRPTLIGVSCHPGGSEVDMRDRMTGIETNLDDVQSGVDAGSREAGHIQKTAASIDRLRLQRLDSADLIGTLIHQVKELQVCVRDQRAAMHELRHAVVGLRDELTRSSAAVRPPPVNAADRQRR